MTQTSHKTLKFVPSRVEGLEGVESVCVTPEHIEFKIGDNTRRYYFHEIGVPIDPLWRRLLNRLAGRRVWFAVADRDWFHSPSKMFFIWYTEPRIKTYMPNDESKESYSGSYFRRIQDVLAQGSYVSCDLG